MNKLRNFKKFLAIILASATLSQSCLINNETHAATSKSTTILGILASIGAISTLVFASHSAHQSSEIKKKDEALKEQMKNKQKLIKTLNIAKKDLETKQKQIDLQNTQIEKLRAREQELLAEAVHNVSDIKRLTFANSDLRTEKRDLLRKKGDLLRENGNIQGENEDLRRENEEYETEIRELDTAIHMLLGAHDVWEIVVESIFADKNIAHCLERRTRRFEREKSINRGIGKYYERCPVNDHDTVKNILVSTATYFASERTEDDTVTWLGGCGISALGKDNPNFAEDVNYIKAFLRCFFSTFQETNLLIKRVIIPALETE